MHLAKFCCVVPYVEVGSPALYPKKVLDFDFAMLYVLWAWKHKIKSNGHCRDLNPSSIL